MAVPFVYDSLEPKFIRLFQLDHSFPLSKTLSGRLVAFRHPSHYDATVKNLAGTYRNWNDMRLVEKRGEAYGYDALSYTWGTSQEVFPLKLQSTGKLYKKGILYSDGIVKREGIINIHRNLYDLLCRLRKAKFERFIWIDAICINQGDDWEKSMQIPLMRDIYQEAKQVKIWLGEATVMEEGALTILPNLVKKLEECASKSHSLNVAHPDTFELMGLPNPDHPIWMALGAFMSRPWFNRLWTLQEAVLPETSPMVYCGDKQLSWETVESFVFSMYACRCRLTDWTITGSVDTSPGFLHGYESVRMIKVCRDSFATARWGTPLDILLNVIRNRSVTNSADMVFGMLALMAHGDQTQITMDVSLPVERVYFELARYYILNEPDECILNHTASQIRRSGLPSWCPDFNSPQSTVPLASNFYGGYKSADQVSTGFRAGFNESRKWETVFGEPGKWEKPMAKKWLWKMQRNAFHRRRLNHGLNDPSHPDYITVDSNAMHLNASGVFVDRIAEVIKPNDGIANGAGAWNDLDNLTKTLAWEKQCLCLAQEVFHTGQEIPHAYWRALIANLTWNSDATHVVWDEHGRADHCDAYEDFVAYAESFVEYSAGHAPIPDQMTIGSRVFATEFFRVTRNRCFFSTTQGRIGIGPADTKPGDDVCIIIFCPTPYILRKQGSVNQFIGDAYVNGLMYGQALDMVDKGELAKTRFIIA
ncbi:MAG: hypothetical protein Q9218_006492 [Villophora microphyllina]